MDISYQIISDVESVVGESSRWDPVHQRLFWIDVQQPYLFCYNYKDKISKSFKLPSPMNCIDLDLNGDLIGVMSNSLVKIAVVTENITLSIIKNNLIDIDEESFNDGRLDNKGNFWIGTLDRTYEQPIGKLYRISPTAEVHLMDQGFIVSNGMGWDPLFTKFYFTDSINRVIYQYKFNPDSCEIYDKQLFIQFPEEQGYPDGLHVDMNGCIWIAGWASYRLYQYSAQGSLIKSIKLPAKNLTSCCFGGHDLKTVFVTSANFDLLDMNDVGDHAGAVFASEIF